MRFFALTLLAFSLITLQAEDWPQFRGPTGDGIATAKNVPLEFGEQNNLAWKTEIPGRGWSSPVFDGEAFWLTTAMEKIPTAEEQRSMMKKQGVREKAFDELQVASSVTLALLKVHSDTGEILLERTFKSLPSPDAIHMLNSYASPTPVLSGNLVISHFGTFGTFAFDKNTNEIAWEKTIKLNHSVGPGSSPFVMGELLILICDGTDQQFVTALDVKTGETVWKTDRPEIRATNVQQKKAYNTPILITDKAGREQLICMGAQWLISYEPDTGKEIWRFDHGSGFSVVPRPVFSEKHQLVFVSTGYGKPKFMAVRVDGSGDVTDQDKLAWQEPKRIPAKPSPLLIGDELYLISDGGVGSCFDAGTGKLHWNARIPGNYSASPIFADGNIYVANQEGAVTVFAPEKTYRELFRNQIEGSIMASPIALDGSLILRSDTALYRFDK